MWPFDNYAFSHCSFTTLQIAHRQALEWHSKYEDIICLVEIGFQELVECRLNQWHRLKSPLEST